MEPVDGAPVIIGTSHTRVTDETGPAADSFARWRAIAFSNVLDPPLTETLLRVSDRSTFVADVVEGLGHREVEAPARAGAAITLALKRPNLLRWIEAVTGCGPLGEVDGRLAQARPGGLDQLTWHDDMIDRGRRLAITINLTDRPYEGGEFELRAKGSDAVLLRHRHVRPGSALLFEVAPGLEHRVLPVLSGGPRRVYAGWFFRAQA